MKKEALVKETVKLLHILEVFPCDYRLWIRMQTGDCYCSVYDRYVRIKYCMLCDKRKTKKIAVWGW
jgi:hypothetical protein